jgi:hypothetical protein
VGDEVILTINPLRSGAPGGAYQPDRAKFRDGTAVAVPRDGDDVSAQRQAPVP